MYACNNVILQKYKKKSLYNLLLHKLIMNALNSNNNNHLFTI